MKHNDWFLHSYLVLACIPILFAVGGVSAQSMPGGVNGDLLKAAETGDVGRIEELLGKGADIGTSGGNGNTPLITAAVRGHTAAVTLLLTKGGDVKARNKFGASALDLAAGRGQSEVVRALLAHGANPNERDGDGRIGDVPIIRAARSGSVDTAKALLEHGANVNEKNKIDATALMGAAMNGRSEMVLFLLKNGADAKARDNEGRKSLGQLGTRCITVEAAQALKEQGSYEQAETNQALLNAVIGPSNCIEIVKYLVEAGGDPNRHTANGDTALILAAVWGHTEAVRFLVSKGADVSIKNKAGKTALDEAKNSQIRQLLRDAQRGQ